MPRTIKSKTTTAPRGRPKLAEHTHTLNLRLHPEEVAALDAYWHDHQLNSRMEGMRQLVDRALELKPSKTRRAPEPIPYGIGRGRSIRTKLPIVPGHFRLDQWEKIGAYWHIRRLPGRADAARELIVLGLQA